MISEKIKIVLVKRDKSKAWLAEQLGCTSSNLYAKLRRDNFSEKEVKEICEILDCDLEINLVLRDSKEKF